MSGDVAAFFAIALGVVVAVVWPILRAQVGRLFNPGAERAALPEWITKYLLLGAFALVTALILLAVYRTQNPGTLLSFWPAFLLGFAWEAGMEKALLGRAV